MAKCMLLVSACVLLQYTRACNLAPQWNKTFEYPEARRDETVVDEYFGTKIADPYRWMEVPDSEEIKDFIEAENNITRSFLDSSPFKKVIQDRLTELWNYRVPKYRVPFKILNRYFSFEKTDLQKQDVMYVQQGLNGKPRVFIDFNKMSKDGSISYAFGSFSGDGSSFAYSLADSGSDWVTMHVKDAVTGEDYPEVLKNIKNTFMAWTKNSKGFFYSCFLEQPDESGVSENQKLCYHRVNTTQEKDVVVVEFPEEPTWGINFDISDEGDYLLVYVSRNPGDTVMLFADLSQSSLQGPLQLKQVVNQFDAYFQIIANEGPVFIFLTNQNAPNLKLVKIDFNNPAEEHWETLIPEHPTDLMDFASAVYKDKLVIHYIRDNKITIDKPNHFLCFDKPKILAREHRYVPRMIREAIEIKKYPNFNREDGWNLSNTWDPIMKNIKSHVREQTDNPIDTVSAFCVHPELFARKQEPFESVLQLHSMVTGDVIHNFDIGVGTIVDFNGDKEMSEIFYQFKSFLTPGTVYHIDLKEKQYKPTVFREVKIKGFDATKYEAKQIFYSSKDGTRIPMFIISKKGLPRDGSRPALLFGFGGLNTGVDIVFNVMRIVFMQHFEGYMAIANIRGGDEYGERWYNAGRLLNKQNVFDDFIAAGEYLVREGYTQPSLLTMQGFSAGGLVVAACANQRPDLMGAAVVQTGVLDILRYQKFTKGSSWTSEYGTSDNKTEFEYLLKYSPLHNIHPPNNVRGASYPATLVMTADPDDVMEPMHSLKYTATLQHAVRNSHQRCPQLLRVGTNTFHLGGGTIDENTDMLTFMEQALGIKFKK